MRTKKRKLVQKTIGEQLARELFKVGDLPVESCTRIAFKCKESCGDEIETCGFCEKALAEWFDQWFRYNTRQ